MIQYLYSRTRLRKIIPGKDELREARCTERGIDETGWGSKKSRGRLIQVKESSKCLRGERDPDSRRKMSREKVKGDVVQAKMFLKKDVERKWVTV